MTIEPVFHEAAERLADAAEDVLFAEFSTENVEELRNAWQAYVETADDTGADAARRARATRHVGMDHVTRNRGTEETGQADR